MSINIQLDGKLQKISGQTMTKEKIVEKLGYTPANESTVDANIAELNSNLDVLEGALENHKNNMSDIDAGSADDEFVIADPSGNVIAKFDDEGLHTTSIEAESFTSKDKELAVYDDNGNAAFKVDENGITHAAKLELNSGDVDAQLDTIKASVSEHANKTDIHVTATDKANWNSKSTFSGEFKDLKNSPIVEDDSGEVVYADTEGRIIFKIDGAGAHTTELSLNGGNVDERLNTLSAGLSAHTSASSIHITAQERSEWQAKASTEYVDQKVADLVASAPETLDTLNELATALGNDKNFATTVATQIGERAKQSDFVEHKTDTVSHITAAERKTWNAKSDFTGEYSKLTGAPDILDDESGNLIVADTAGRIVAKIGEFDDGTNGIETTKIVVDGTDIKAELLNKANSADVAEELGKKVSTTRKINGKALSTDITLIAEDVGALPNTTEIPSIEGLATEDYVNSKLDHSIGDSTIAEYVEGVIKDLDYPVDSINGKTGAVILNYEDIENAPNISEDNSGNLVIADPNGNIIFRSDGNGFETTTITAETVIVDGEDIKEFILNKIAEASLSGGDVDLSGYATVSYVDSKTKVDDAISETSTNPVQNKVVYDAIGLVFNAISQKSQVQIITWEADD